MPIATEKGILRHTNAVVLLGDGLDPFFHQPLWLQVTVKNHTLWAYHLRHVHFLKDLVEAILRERNGMENANQSLVSRLPRWMTAKTPPGRNDKSTHWLN